MLKTRVIPCLQLIDESLVKAVKFGNHGYIGDYINTVRIFNELEVDELCFLDIRATSDGRNPNFDILHHIADECFMPLSYGGAIKDFETARRILSIGFEKIIINTAAYHVPNLIKKISEYFGNQAVVASVDVKRNLWGKHHVYINNGKEKIREEPVEWVRILESAGAGELLLTSMDREGTWSGYDLEITKKVTDALSIPVVANGGAGNIGHIADVIKNGGASAAALGSMVVYQKKGMGVLVNFPDRKLLEAALKI
ncbi:MAG: imidazole glycerol phosphate synthase subunit HisF [Sphingobacteriales bacterium 17-39-43]|jgi:cyclase|uniref:AglZ/HisF2 family acetamidino modification protein n=1 Tax=Daejeonella sp. TaxID=2805397 RepID=UPI000BCD3464|nr:AglZ/HisF2 family acetamidino modification protein [Daejeonella sp.]OYX92451.1 MAG: imidazole glycerol phosphate synthase subunit HisF [Sphingobacteriia bacterium 35-40-5]OYZ30187.1 MAG: imidazole glycerol phosphate synthase subunit HisF [Sphingobacteriales bacterium 16-39-50]OZA22930.1 MAG: imidazole glycerol phosphate synthase subunit HisF [Sphingobacteriales bacterium 17-39-43]HQT24176.1 AglZ/HisF2 family acetamidino modification protein [Daejeonella sp.]HQT58786.1 AglZ/HisF2 family acet